MTKFSTDILKRTWPNAAGETVTSDEWYGRRKDGPGLPWKWVKLYADKRESLRKWEALRAEAERLDSGATTAEAERLRTAPIADVLKDYHDGLRRQGRGADHIKISEWTLAHMARVGGWRLFKDVTRANIEGILDRLEREGATASYRNKFVARAKAFVHAVLPDGWPDPLRKLRKVSEKGARRTRERKAAGGAHLVALLALDGLPDHRRLAYALAGLNGLRRNEVAALVWADVHLAAPIPFVELPQKQGDKKDHVPLHPYVVALLRPLAARPASVPACPVVGTVPDVRTVAKDWARVGAAFTDERGRRLDYHALRHTFTSLLDLAGCSRATMKRLTRHAAQDVTDGYAHAELAEMLAALTRLPSPQPPPEQPTRTRYRTRWAQSGNGGVNAGHHWSTPAGRTFEHNPGRVMGLVCIGHHLSSSVLTNADPRNTIKIPAEYPSGVRDSTYNTPDSTPRRSSLDTMRTRPTPATPARCRCFRFGGRVLPRVPRPVRTPHADACRADVARLLAAAVAERGVARG